MDTKSENRRKFQRINYNGLANLDFMGFRQDHCHIDNINLTGMFVNGDFRDQYDKNSLLTFSHRDESQNIGIQGKAEVIWTSDTGVALKFDTMTFNNYRSLQQILLFEAEKPSILLKEFPILCPFKITRL